MVLKIKEAKISQGYTPKQVKCSVCAHYESEFVEKPTGWGPTFTVEQKKRCGIGKFDVKSSASCNLFARKT